MTNNNFQEEIQNQVNNMDSEQKDQILENFGRFKSYLADKVSKGEALGLSEEQLAQATEKVANYLAKHEEPRNREEHLLRELWTSGDKEQQHALAHMLLNMVKKQ